MKSDDLGALRRLFSEHPNQLTWSTPFGGQSWLGYAAQIGKSNAVELLVDLGADVNQGDPRENTKALNSAASNGHLDITRYLIEKGALMDVSASVRNPLFAAIVGRSPQIVDLLLRSGIDSHVKYNSETMDDLDAVAFALMRGEQDCAALIANWNCNGNPEKVAHTLEHADAIAQRNARRHG